MPATYTTTAGDVVVMYYWNRDSKLYHGDDARHLYKNGTLVGGPNQDVLSMMSYGSSATPTLIVAEDLAAQDHTLHTYDTSNYAELEGTSVPTAEKVFPHLGRVFATCDTAYPSRLYCCAASDHTNWGGTYGQGNYWDIDPSGGGDIVDAVPFRGVIYVWKERGVYRVLGDDTEMLIVEKLYDIDKPVAGTVVDCQRGIIYATQAGVFPLGEISGEAADLTRNVEMSILTNLASGKAAYSPELSAYVLVDGTTTIWVSNHHNRPDVWTKFTAPVAMSSVYSGNGLWFGSIAGDVYLYDHDAVKDDAAAFTVRLKTGFWDFDAKRLRKRVRGIEGPFNAQNNASVEVKLYKDGSGTATHTETITADSETLTDGVDFNCKNVAVELTYSSLTGPAVFGGFKMWHLPAGERK